MWRLGDWVVLFAIATSAHAEAELGLREGEVVRLHENTGLLDTGSDRVCVDRIISFCKEFAASVGQRASILRFNRTARQWCQETKARLVTDACPQFRHETRALHKKSAPGKQAWARSQKLGAFALIGELKHDPYSAPIHHQSDLRHLDEECVLCKAAEDPRAWPASFPALEQRVYSFTDDYYVQTAQGHLHREMGRPATVTGLHLGELYTVTAESGNENANTGNGTA
jgi:hypothetical protein